MSTGFESNAFDVLVDPLFNLFTPEQTKQILEYRAGEPLEARIEELSRKSTEGELTTQERAEFEGYARASRFIAVMQAKAKRNLQRNYL